MARLLGRERPAASAECGAEAANRTASKLMRAFTLWLQMFIPVMSAREYRDYGSFDVTDAHTTPDLTFR